MPAFDLDAALVPSQEIRSTCCNARIVFRDLEPYDGSSSNLEVLGVCVRCRAPHRVCYAFDGYTSGNPDLARRLATVNLCYDACPMCGRREFDGIERENEEGGVVSGSRLTHRIWFSLFCQCSGRFQENYDLLTVMKE